jgi:hypothetical protein
LMQNALFIKEQIQISICFGIHFARLFCNLVKTRFSNFVFNAYVIVLRFSLHNGRIHLR